MSYSHLTITDRIKIETYLELGLKPCQIVNKLGVHKSTISRELRRCQNGYSSYLAQEKQGIKSVTLLPNTARGEYDNVGDVSGNYHIYFTAYTDDNSERTLRVELSFPDASIPPFTLFHPNPYKNKSQKMTNWFVENIEESEEASK